MFHWSKASFFLFPAKKKKVRRKTGAVYERTVPHRSSIANLAEHGRKSRLRQNLGERMPKTLSPHLRRRNADSADAAA